MSIPQHLLAPLAARLAVEVVQILEPAGYRLIPGLKPDLWLIELDYETRCQVELIIPVTNPERMQANRIIELRFDTETPISKRKPLVWRAQCEQILNQAWELAAAEEPTP